MNIFSIIYILLVLLVKPVYAEEVMYFYYGQGCPHCANVERFFEENSIYDKYSIESKEIYFNQENADEFLAKTGGKAGVPTLIYKNQVITGDRPIIKAFESGKFGNGKMTGPTETTKAERDLTIFAVVGASLADAINPCAFAVLVILMTTILIGGDQKKALRAGLAFASSIFLSYFLMGLGLYKALGSANLTNVFYKIVGGLAIFLGLFNLKDWLWYGKGFLMEVPMAWRPKLKDIISSVTSPVGAFGIGFVVSLFLLPCTSGPYIVILGMLAKKAFTAKAIAYLILYNLIFVSPMILITHAVYKGFDPQKAEKIRQKNLRTLHLIAGIILIGMGTAILLGII
ncbi:cytochrome c biogenesis protein CcdA [Patescibacteria group bacterium]